MFNLDSLFQKGFQLIKKLILYLAFEPFHRGYLCSPIIPIYTYEPLPTLTIAKELYEGGVYVNSSLPPAAAPHECLLRTSLMATHTHALIDEAVGVIAEVLRRYEL